MRFNLIYKLARLFLCFAAIQFAVFAQETNPVDRRVSNPITDTPSVNPVEQENLLPPPRPAQIFPNTEDLSVEANKQNVSGPENARVVVYEGNVDAKLGIYRLQADKVTIYEADNRMLAEGNVVFDQGNDQRITGTRSEWNYKTKLGYFENSTGFTNQTSDGTVIFFTADRVERISLQTIVVTNGKVTACGDDLVPKWSFETKRAKITTDDRVKLFRPTFKVLGVPVLPLPYASISTKKRDRQSGFLTPTIGSSDLTGFRVSNAYYQTLGDSADVTFRNDIYSRRGLGFGFDARTRLNERSYFNFGFYAVRDRIFGEKESPQYPDQGGTSIYAEGVQYFPNGFTAAADVRLTSNLAFRQTFSDRIQQIISPIEISQVFVNKSWNNYSLDFLARSQVINLPDITVSTRNLPSVYFEKRPSPLSFVKEVPVYLSFRSSLEGVSRRERLQNAQLADTLQVQRTPALGQRFDFNPQIEIPLYYKGFALTTTAGLRTTYYSNSQVPETRQVIGRDLIRGYGELEFDFRPPALAKNFYYGDGLFRFRHVIEPYVAYRWREGVDDRFQRTILFDYNDTVNDTSEIEYGLTNRFYTRRYTEIPLEGVSRETLRKISSDPSTPLSIQPYEIFTLTIRGKYFFDPYFGGALVPGRRNQIRSITDLTAFTFGGVPRRFSPLNLDATYRPRRTIFANTRMDLGVQNFGLRDLSVTLGYDTRLLKIFQTFYYTRAVGLVPSLQQFNDPFGREPGTRRGSQWSPTLFVGNSNRGVFGGASFFFDFQNRRGLAASNLSESPLINSTLTLGYAFDCCSLMLQRSTFDIGGRNEDRFLFTFRLNGIGTFGTEQFGQALR